MTDHDKQLEELMEAASQPLHPDLVAHVQQRGDMTWIHHPLVIFPMYSDAMSGFANEQYERKLTAVARAFEEKDWHTFVYLRERPYRLDAFGEIQRHLADEDYWELLASIWTDSDNIREQKDEWRWMLDENRDPTLRHLLMTEWEREALAAMPESFPVYRGYSHVDAAKGLSWTVDRERGLWFARRFASETKTPMLASGTISRGDVIAFFTGRGENEIVALPELVSAVSIEELPQP